MRFLKLRYIIPGLLLIVIIVALCLFFIGGLKASDYVYTDNIPFSEEGFEFVTDKQLTEIKSQNNNKAELGTNKLICHNEKFALVMDYDTTILTLVVKDSNWSETNFLSGKCFKTADNSNSTNMKTEERSNILLRYFSPSGTIQSTTLDSFSGSVRYNDRQAGKEYRYYRLKQLTEAVDGVNGIDILYQIGSFNNIDASFPKRMERSELVDTFIGNTVFYVTNYSDMGEKIGDRYVMKYKGTGYTNNAECAAYLEENGLATVKEAQSVFEIGEPAGKWLLSDMTDENGRLKLTAGVDYNVPAGSESTSPCTTNPFINNLLISNLFESSSNAYQLLPRENEEDPIGNTNTDEYTPRSSQIAIRKNEGTLVLQQLNKIMYNIEPVSVEYDENGNMVAKGNYFSISKMSNPEQNGKPLFYDYNNDGILGDDELVQMGGFQARDEDGNWLYDENGKPVQAAYTLEKAAIQNEVFGLAAESTSTAFQICLRVSLDENGLVATVINESIVEGGLVATRYDEIGDKLMTQTINHSNKLFEITVFPYLTVDSNKESVGHIILPDGSGGVISFNSVKDAQNAKAYSKHLYGMDLTIPQKQRGVDSETLMLGMYGFLNYTDKKGVLAIVDKGASQTTINADFTRQSNSAAIYNYARFVTNVREQETVFIQQGSSFTKWSIDLFQGDLCYKYNILDEDEINYVDLAKKYREYLIDKYDLNPNGDETKKHVLSAYFIGAFEKKALAIGIVYDKDYSLTTFKQAEEIVDELANNGVDDFNVGYMSWTKDNMNLELTDDVTVAKVLGGKKEMVSFSDYLKEKGYDFFPEYWIARGSGYDFPYGSLKYSPKSIGSTYSTVVQFVLSTGQVDTKGGHGGFISPKFYKSLIIRYLNEYLDLGISGINISDLGNSRTADYAKKSQIYTETSAYIQQESLALLNDNLKLQIEAPFDYAFKYVNNATFVPQTTTLYAGMDYAIPLYQLVVSGLFDYSGDCVNFNNENSTTWFLLKAIETGSNLSYLLAAEDTNILLDTQYTMYYGAYYKNWKYNIIYMNKVLNSTGIYESRLVYHEYVSDNVVKVKYENGLTILINYENETYNDLASGVSVAGNWFVILEEGR